MASEARKSKASPNVYTALLLIAMLALATAVVFVARANLDLTGDQQLPGAMHHPFFLLPRQ